MDYLDPKKKRAHEIRLFIGYILTAVALALATLILLLQAYGYDINHRTGKIIQNGLIFVSSAPVSADVYLNGTANGHTSTKLTVPAGPYTISLKKTGYRTWTRTFTLEGGSVDQLNYPVLFPTKLDTKDIQTYANAPTLATQSPDRHWLLVQPANTLSSLDNYDLNNPTTPATLLTLPANLLTNSTGAQSLSLVEWSTDNRHVLLKHTFPGGDEFVMVDRDTPADSFNVNKLFGVAPTEVALQNKSFDQLYLYDAKAETLQQADVKTKQVTPFLTRVIAFKPYGSSTVLYATDDSQTPGKNAISMWDGKQSYLIHYYPTSPSYLLDIAQYNGDQYVVVSPVGSGEVYVYKNPLTQAKQASKIPPAPFTDLKMDQAAFISFSATAQFISAQSGNRFAVYDALADRRYYYELSDPVTIDQKATWMDGDRLTLTLNGKTTIFDYDGINEQSLTASLPDDAPFFNRDFTLLFNISPSVQAPTKFAVTQTDLKVK